jgi:hypothetical protein
MSKNTLKINNYKIIIVKKKRKFSIILADGQSPPAPTPETGSR